MSKLRICADEQLVSSKDVAQLRSQIAAVAQQVYDAWEQDEEGMDEELGEGGICQDIAEAVCGLLAENGIECGEVSNSVGDQHVWAIAKLSDGVFIVDINPSVYEEGGGYSWRKRKDVVFDASDVIIESIDSNPDSFEQYLGD